MVGMGLNVAVVNGRETPESASRKGPFPQERDIKKPLEMLGNGHYGILVYSNLPIIPKWASECRQFRSLYERTNKGCSDQ